MGMKDKIVFYDGDCGFCNRTVAYLLKHDRGKEIYFASIQSAVCKKIFDEYGWDEPDLSTFYYVEGGNLYKKSTAALKVVRNFKYPQRLMLLGFVFPRFLRDFVYDLVARNRKRISKGYCVVPSEEDRSRFL